MRRKIISSILVLLLFTSALFAQEATDEPLPFDSAAPLQTEEAELTPEENQPATTTVTLEPIEVESATPTETLVPVTVTTAPVGGSTYIVQRGDTLFRIAQRFGTTTNTLAAANGIANPSLIFVGQQLTIPGGQPQQPPPQATQPPPPSGGTYTVQRGDNLYRIAVRNNTTVAVLITLNPTITNANIIFVGQQITLPGGEAVAPTVTATPAENDSTIETASNTTYQYGIEVFFSDSESIPALVEQVKSLGMGWVKVRVDWRELEATEGQVDYTVLDAIVSELTANEIDILFTVVNAPIWARSSQDENGPPDDLSNYTTFINALAEHYTGQVGAYEIWDEPNLRRNWNCDRRICDTDYAEMLRLSYNAVKIADPDALVVSAGLAPTGFNDGINAIEDRLYLQTLYQNGLAQFSDAIGVHPGGWANPPDAICCEQPVGVETHYENDSFYFADNLAAYNEIMTANNDTQTPMWITKFGWGTSEDTDPPGEINIFVSYTSLAEQAIYVSRAFEVAKQYPLVTAMFLSNLNGCITGRAELCYDSLISPAGEPRLVFDAVATVEK